MITKSQINLIRSLKDKSIRIENQLFICEGEKLVEEILNSNFSTKFLYFNENSISSELKKRFSEIRNKKNNLIIENISSTEMERISHLKTATSVLAVVELPMWKTDTKDIKEKLSLALDGVQDPGNLGTIIRIADWFGIKDIFCSYQSADLFNPKVVQATMGAITRVKVHYIDLVQFLTQAQKDGMAIYGTFLDGDNIYSRSLTQTGIIVMGNEGKGVSKEIASLVTDKLYIPPYPVGVPTSESLNVGVATAIVCSEFRRR